MACTFRRFLCKHVFRDIEIDGIGHHTKRRSSSSRHRRKIFSLSHAKWRFTFLGSFLWPSRRQIPRKRFQFQRATDSSFDLLMPYWRQPNVTPGRFDIEPPAFLRFKAVSVFGDPNNPQWNASLLQLWRPSDLLCTIEISQIQRVRPYQLSALNQRLRSWLPDV
jgi:hypothetical protein